MNAWGGAGLGDGGGRLLDAVPGNAADGRGLYRWDPRVKLILLVLAVGLNIGVAEIRLSCGLMLTGWVLLVVSRVPLRRHHRLLCGKVYQNSPRSRAAARAPRGLHVASIRCSRASPQGHARGDLRDRITATTARRGRWVLFERRPGDADRTAPESRRRTAASTSRASPGAQSPCVDPGDRASAAAAPGRAEPGREDMSR